MRFGTPALICPWFQYWLVSAYFLTVKAHDLPCEHVGKLDEITAPTARDFADKEPILAPRHKGKCREQVEGADNYRRFHWRL